MFPAAAGAGCESVKRAKTINNDGKELGVRSFVWCVCRIALCKRLSGCFGMLADVERRFVVAMAVDKRWATGETSLSE